MRRVWLMYHLVDLCGRTHGTFGRLYTVLPGMVCRTVFLQPLESRVPSVCRVVRAPSPVRAELLGIIVLPRGELRHFSALRPVACGRIFTSGCHQLLCLCRVTAAVRKSVLAAFLSSRSAFSLPVEIMSLFF